MLSQLLQLQIKRQCEAASTKTEVRLSSLEELLL